MMVKLTDDQLETLAAFLRQDTHLRDLPLVGNMLDVVEELIEAREQIKMLDKLVSQKIRIAFEELGQRN